HVATALHTAVAPEFHIVAQATFVERTMRQPYADFSRESDMTQRMRPCRACPTVVTRDIDDVRASLRYADCAHADARYNGNFERDFGVRIGGFEFVNQLRQVFNRVEIMVVTGRDQVNARCGVPCGCYLLGDFVTR